MNEMKDMDFEQELYNHFGQIKDFTLGMRIGKYFYELGCHRIAEKQTSGELEKEIESCLWQLSDDPSNEELCMFARHFAEWQKEQDEKEQADLFTIVALDAAQRAKEQMLKEAVKMYPCYDEEHNLIGFSTNYEAKGAYGQLIRIIIVKED